MLLFVFGTWYALGFYITLCCRDEIDAESSLDLYPMPFRVMVYGVRLIIVPWFAPLCFLSAADDGFEMFQLWVRLKSLPFGARWRENVERLSVLKAELERRGIRWPTVAEELRRAKNRQPGDGDAKRALALLESMDPEEGYASA